MKKIWEAPVLETIGMNMTAQGQNNQGTDGFFTDASGQLLMGFSSGKTDDHIDGEVVGPFTPVDPEP